jgi:predicted GNAT family acetyltransferase
MSKAVAVGCRFKNNKQKARSIKKIMECHADVPKSEISKAVESKKLKNWSLLCDPKDRTKIISAARTEKVLWYQWDLKNLVTDPKYRGQGLGTKALTQSTKRAVDKGALVLTADITVDNKQSLAVAKKAGFKPSFKYCWKKGEKPAYVMHHVLYPPNKKGVCEKP